MTKKLVWFGIAAMTTLLGLILLWQFRTALIYFLVSLAIAAAVMPLVKRWARRGIVMRIVWMIVFVLVLGGSGFLFALGSVSAVREIKLLANTVSVQNEWMLPGWLQNSSTQLGLAKLPPPSQLFAALTGDQGQLVLPVVLGFTRGAVGLVSGALVILFMSLYWSINQVHFERLWLSLLPPGRRNRTRTIWNAIQADLGAYIRSQINQSVLAGVLLGLGYWVIGSPYPILLALAGALASLIPMVGIGLAVMVPLVIGLVTSLQISLFTALYALVILIALEVWVKPRLFNHKQYSPILMVVVLIVMAKVFGLAGVIAAPPFAAAIQILWSHLSGHGAVSSRASQISDLKERQGLLSAAIQAMNEPPEPLVTSSMERLTRLIEKAEPVLQEILPVEPLKGSVQTIDKSSSDGALPMNKNHEGFHE